MTELDGLLVDVSIDGGIDVVRVNYESYKRLIKRRGPKFPCKYIVDDENKVIISIDKEVESELVMTLPFAFLTLRNREFLEKRREVFKVE